MFCAVSFRGTLSASRQAAVADFEVAEAKLFEDAELLLEGELALLFAPLFLCHGLPLRRDQ